MRWSLAGFIVTALCLSACESAAPIAYRAGISDSCTPGTTECVCAGIASCDAGLTCDTHDVCVPLGTATGYVDDGFNYDGQDDLMSSALDELSCDLHASAVFVDSVPSCVCDDGWQGSGDVCVPLGGTPQQPACP